MLDHLIECGQSIREGLYHSLNSPVSMNIASRIVNADHSIMRKAAVAYADCIRDGIRSFGSDLPGFPIVFHPHIEVCKLLRELLSKRLFFRWAGSRIQRFF